MKKILVVLLLILLSGCTNTEDPGNNVPTMLTEYIEVGLTMNDNPIYYMRKTRSDIGVICSYEDVEVIALYNDNLGTHVLPIYLDVEGGCNSYYYYYNDVEEGYESINPLFRSGLITIDDILSVEWGSPIYVTRIQFGDQWTIEGIKKEMADRDLNTLLSYEMQYCVNFDCFENMNFAISDFPGLEDELVIDYDLTTNSGVILTKLSDGVWNVFLEPIGTGMYQFPLGYQVTNPQPADHLSDLVLDED